MAKKTFGNIFTYTSEEAYTDGMHTFSGCKLLQQLKQGDKVIVDVGEQIDEVLIDLIKGIMKLHVDTRIVTTSFDVSFTTVKSVKSDSETDSDFDYETSTDDEESE